MNSNPEKNLGFFMILIVEVSAGIIILAAIANDFNPFSFFN